MLFRSTWRGKIQEVALSPAHAGIRAAKISRPCLTCAANHAADAPSSGMRSRLQRPLISAGMARASEADSISGGGTPPSRRSSFLQEMGAGGLGHRLWSYVGCLGVG